MQIEGIVEQVERLPGWGKDIRVKINGAYYYNRIHDKTSLGLAEMAKDNIGKRVVFEYQELKTKTSDWFLDRVLFTSFGMPRKYNGIERIKAAVDSADIVNSGNGKYPLPENKLLSA